MISLYNMVQTNLESARQFVYRILSSNIRNFFLRPDEKLSEIEVSQQLGVSRTPVHDTFIQLSHEKMLIIESRRGTSVPRLDPEYIKQVIWMNYNITVSVLENLYIIRPAKESLKSLKQFVEEEKTVLQSGDFSQMAQWDSQFYLELFRMAGFLALHQTLCKNSVDLFRLTRIEDNLEYWQNAVCQHEKITDALLAHDHETACSAVSYRYNAYEPILEEMMEKYPQFFKE